MNIQETIHFVSGLTNQALVQDFKDHLVDECEASVGLLIRIAEIDKRQLHRQAGYSSMRKYCVREFQVSSDMAAKRIVAACTARRCPGVYEALADGRLHLTAVVLLAPKMTRANATALIAAAEWKTVFEIKMLLAELFPQFDTPTSIRPIAPVQSSSSPREDTSTRPIDPSPSGPVDALQLVSSAATNCAESRDLNPVFDISNATPLSPGKLKLEATITQEFHAKVEYARNLLGHRVASGDIVEVLDLALTMLIRDLEKRKFSATNRPRKNARPSNGRGIPAHVQRDVWMRDGGQCTFVSDSGHRCDERGALEYDHIDPVARGGRSTVANLRLRCRPHNQLEAERVYGAEFMQHKREEALRAAEERAAAERAKELDVVPWLRQLKCSLADARRAAEFVDKELPTASLEDRVKAALRFLSPRTRSQTALSVTTLPRVESPAGGETNLEKAS